MKKLFALFAILFAFYANAQDPVTNHAGYVNIGMMDAMATNDTILVRNGPGRLGYRLKSAIDQQLSLTGNIISLTGSPSVDLTPILGGSGGTWGGIVGTLSNQLDLQAELNAKQNLLVSATNIRTINGLDLLGAGNITIATGGDLLSTNNLSDVLSAPTSLANIGGAALAGAVFTGNITAPAIIKTGATGDDILLGNGTTTPLSALSSGALLIANNLSDVASIPISQQNLNVEPGVDVEVYAVNTDKDHTNDLYAISGSPVGNPSWWVGNKAAYYAAGPIVADFIVILDSVAPATGSGLGDMLKSVYDINENNNVDNSEALEGFAGSYYLNRSNHTGTQLAATISDIQDAITNNAAVLANTAKVSNATHTGDVTGSVNLIIANEVVTSQKIANGTINNVDIQPGGISSGNIANDAIQSQHIFSSAVGPGDIQAGTVTATELATASVNTLEIADNAVTTAKIAAGAVGNTDIAADAVTADKIATNAVGASEITADAVGSSEIAAGAVGTSEIANGAILLVDLNTETYTAGTFVPTLIGATSGTYTFTSVIGEYVKVGKLVHINIILSSVNGTAPTGELRLGNLPFSSGWSTNVSGSLVGASQNHYVLLPRVFGNYIHFPFKNTNSTESGAMTNVDFTGGIVHVSGTYITN